LWAYLAIPGLCLVAVAACSFDADRLRRLPPSAADGPVASPDAFLDGGDGTAGQADAGAIPSADSIAASLDLATPSQDGVSHDVAIAWDSSAASEVAFPAEVSPLLDAEADTPALTDAPATGGAITDGGNSATGGSSQTSDAAAAGGTTGSGGAAASGGTIATGGTSGSGGTTATGGTIATGGTMRWGGTTATGGSIATGGGSGGTTATGGATGSGGAIGPVTTTCPGAVPAGITSSWCSCAQYGQWAKGASSYYNNIWGSSAGPQCIWATTTTTWGVAANHPTGTTIRSFPNISVSPQKAIGTLNSYVSNFDVTVPSSGSWETVYVIWVKGNTGARVEISLSMNQNLLPGEVADRTNVLVGGHTWNVHFVSASLVALVRTSSTSSGSVDILSILSWLIANNSTGKGVFTTSWTLDQLQFGFQITSDGSPQAFVTNSFSVTSS
jgi:hypothetical protein